MCVLLDECLPRRLRDDLAGHEVRTVPEMGWAGKSNGDLLRLAAAQFDVFLTADRGIQYQQNLTDSSIAVIALAAPSNDIGALRPLIPDVLRAMAKIRRSEFVRVGA